MAAADGVQFAIYLKRGERDGNGLLCLLLGVVVCCNKLGGVGGLKIQNVWGNSYG